MVDLVTPAELDAVHKQYERLQMFCKHLADGRMRSLIVSGPPGVGKSYMVKQYLRQYGHAEQRYLHGKITPLSLFDALYKQREPKQVVVLDDTDSIFKDGDGQNLLKAAMDTTPVRQIDWASTTALLERMKLPPSFKFAGSIVLITNVGFDGNTRLNIHLRAIKDRSYPLQVGSDSQAAKFAMIVYMVERQDMLRAYEFSQTEKEMLLQYISANLDSISYLSLRFVSKLADLYKVEPENWRYMAESLLTQE